jgi:hypothetical protein
MGILCFKAIHWTLPKIKCQQLQKGYKVESLFFQAWLKIGIYSTACQSLLPTSNLVHHVTHTSIEQ